MPEVEAELKVVQVLTDYYQQQGNLNSLDASAESLSYLKAAAVCIIDDLEHKRATAVVPRVKQAFTEQIFTLVQKFNWESYRRIRLPTALRDYSAEGECIGQRQFNLRLKGATMSREDQISMSFSAR